VRMDGPLTGLDVGSQEGILVLLKSLTDRGVTLLVSTHDLDVAAAQFARIMLLNRKLVAFGPPASVMRTELLLPTFGGHASVHVVGAENGAADNVVVYDTCCEGAEGDHAGARGNGDQAPAASRASDTRSDR